MISPMRHLRIILLLLLMLGFCHTLAAQPEFTTPAGSDTTIASVTPSHEALHACALAVQANPAHLRIAERRAIDLPLPTFLTPLPSWQTNIITEARFSYSAVLPQPPAHALSLPLLN